jgi:cell division protein FtsI (penicillin-binding protein 3)
MESRSSSTRLLIIAAVLALWTGASLVRLGYLQIFRYADFLARAEHQQQHIVEISPKRADIFDRNLHALAMSATVNSCFAVPNEISDPEMVARLLGGVLHVSFDEMEARLASSHSFVWIARKLPPEIVARIQALNLRGIYFQPEDQRFYPKRDLAASVLGYVDVDEKGLGGIEYGLDNRIRSKPGRMLILADAKSRWFDSSDKTPDAGTSVVLTIDENIQFMAEKELDEAIAKTGSKAGTIIVQDPSTGEILAMANWPTFNPNAPGESPAESRVNRAVASLYEPGSVFKIVTLSAAIDQGLTNPNDVVDCQHGAIYIAGHRIRDHASFGLLTVAQILAKSSDVGAIKIGLRLGAPKFYDYIRSYGFGSLTDVDLPGENRGLLRRVENWTPISVGSISMGQEVGVTPLQMVNAVSAIANGGLLYRPHVVEALRTPAGGLVPEEQPEPKRVVRATTAATMRNMLEGVVLNGTGTFAKLDGYTAGGKTGTAQKVDPATGRYSPTQLIASFVGFAPINNPALTILVQLDSPSIGSHMGGAVAGPVFKRVAEQALAYLNVPRDEPIPPKTLRASRAAAAESASPDVSDFDPVQIESPEAQEVPAEPEPPTNALPAASIASASPPTVELAEGDGVQLPSLEGKTVRQVTEICQKLGVNPVLVGSGIAQQQQPEAGAMTRHGGSVTVWFGRPAEVAQARNQKGAR